MKEVRSDAQSIVQDATIVYKYNERNEESNKFRFQSEFTPTETLFKQSASTMPFIRDKQMIRPFNRQDADRRNQDAKYWST